VLREVPDAVFKCAAATTPAVSVAAMTAGLLPAKSILTVRRGAGAGPVGTISMPFTGARSVVVAVPVGLAVSVKAVPVMLNLT
jgi:hypothetical protein